jgi:hypothetical protein
MNVIDQMRQSLLQLQAYGGLHFPSPFAVLEAPKMSYMGMPVYTNALCKSRVPVRVHKQRYFNMRPVPGNYHNRVQKKWIKRYGMKDQFVTYATTHGFIVAPEILKKMQRDKLLYSVDDFT